MTPHPFRTSLCVPLRRPQPPTPSARSSSPLCVAARRGSTLQAQGRGTPRLNTSGTRSRHAGDPLSEDVVMAYLACSDARTGVLTHGKTWGARTGVWTHGKALRARIRVRTRGVATMRQANSLHAMPTHS
eukprot:364912-Chlamydomonas_euryale.AAC.23